MKKIVVGQDHFLERVLVAILAQGHLLVEGVPGLAKTLTVKTLARTMRGSFKRIQFTPDLVPADLVGTRIYNQKTGEFATSLGPVFANLLLADEINRAPAKVQSALLEVMQERQVTIAGETPPGARAVPGDGDAEPDRDRRHLSAARGAGRPLHDEGAGRLPQRGGGIRHRRARHRRSRSTVAAVATTEQLLALQRECRNVYVDPVADAIRGAARRGDARPGARPACSDLAPLHSLRREPARDDPPDRGGRALAFLRGRDYALPEDVADLVPDVLRHRLVLSYEALADGITADELMRRHHAQRAGARESRWRPMSVAAKRLRRSCGGSSGR